jgi:hypothetical protein
MRTSDPNARGSSELRSPTGFNGGTPHELLQHVPRMELQFDGDAVQANGVDLPVIAINLSHRTDRWQILSRRMSAIGLSKLVRAPAIEGARLPANLVAALLRSPADATGRGPRSHLTLTPPAIGCFLSHLAIWQWLLGTDLPRVLVLEDDAAPVERFSADRFRDFLGCIVMAGLADRPQGARLARIYYFNGTFAYLITPAGARAWLQNLLPLHAHIDHQMSKVLIEQRHVLPAYYATPHFFEPDWSLHSDCYVPLSDDLAADRELGEIFATSRRTLLEEGRPLLPNS